LVPNPGHPLRAAPHRKIESTVAGVIHGCHNNPEKERGNTFCIVVACWARLLEQGKNALEPIRKVAPTVAEMVMPMPYPALNSAFDALYRPGLRHYWKALFASELSDGAIAAHVEHGPNLPAITSTMRIYPINGVQPGGFRCHGLRLPGCEVRTPSLPVCGPTRPTTTTTTSG
jgi:hypothetical protein